MQRIKFLSESPCWKCGKHRQCARKVKRYPPFQEILDYVMPKSDFDFHNCGLYIAIVADEEWGNKSEQTY